MRRSAVAGCALAMAFAVSLASARADAASPSAPYSAPKHVHHHHHRKHVKLPKNPFALPAMRSYLAGRADYVDAAVRDLRTGKTYTWHPGRREQTASIVKVDILETLLRQEHVLSPAQQTIATGMIEASDNDDATELWDDVGGAPAVTAYDRLAGMTNTTPNLAWGLTETTAPDQLTLLQELISADSLLKPAAQQYELDLMSHIDPGENWGVSGGIPAGVQIALKNGWLPLYGNGDWQINSIGRIRGDGRWYLIAVLTTGNATEGYGIDTIEGVSSRVWNDLKR
jgi:hypothetical protein